MNKKLIRLTETDLRRMVAESVKGVINELDWKTYANAARKRAEQGASDYDIYQLDQAANKALFNKYTQLSQVYEIFYVANQILFWFSRT